MSGEWPEEIRLEAQERAGETTSGLMLTLLRKAEEIGFFRILGEGLGLKMKVYRYSHQDKLKTIVCSIAGGCRHTADIQHKLVPDSCLAHQLGLKRFPDQSQINDFLRSFGDEQVEHLERAHEELLLANSRAGERGEWLELRGGGRLLPLDLDQTPLPTKSMRATGASGGYFGRKRSQYGYQKSVAILGGGIKEVLWQRLDAGNVHAQSALPIVLGKMKRLAEAKGIRPDEVLVRGDSQYGSADSIRQIRDAGYHFLLKGYTPNTAQALALGESEAVWHLLGKDSYGSTLWLADYGEQPLVDKKGAPRCRVVLVVRVGFRKRTKHGKGSPQTTTEKDVSYEHYLTDLGADGLSPQEVVGLYNERATEESFFRSEQDAFGAQYLRTGHKEGEAGFLWLLASTINLLRWLQHSTFRGTPLERMGLVKLVTQVMQIPAHITQTAHSCTIALPRQARLVVQIVRSYLEGAVQLPLPLCFNST